MPIPKSEGEAYIKEYIRLQNELLQLEDLIQSSDENMKKYHSSELISFIFKKDRIDAMFQYDNDANALRIYYGAHSNGDPTLVLVPCQVSEDETSVINKLAGAADRVEQHPKPKTGSGGFGLVGFDLENDPI
jgi:hypothetical protein